MVRHQGLFRLACPVPYDLEPPRVPSGNVTNTSICGLFKSDQAPVRLLSNGLLITPSSLRESAARTLGREGTQCFRHFKIVIRSVQVARDEWSQTCPLS